MTDVVQSAEVTLRVALQVSEDATLEERQKAILRQIRLEMGGGIELKPGLSTANVTLSGTESTREAAERKTAQAESRAEGRLDRQRERHFDRHGHF